MAAVGSSHSGNKRSTGQMALVFLIVNPAVPTVVSGERTWTQLEDVVGIMDVPMLPGGSAGTSWGATRQC